MNDVSKDGAKSKIPLLKEYKVDQLVAGIASGAASTAILHPLDLVKIQFQVQTTSRSAVLAAPLLYTFRFLSLQKKELGVKKGLYRGLSANLAGSAASWGLYFYLYAWMKNGFEPDSKGQLSAGAYFMASSSASALTVLATNPLWVCKTRLCTQDPRLLSAYRGLLDALRRILSEEGLGGLYRGVLPGLIGVSHGAVQFMVYEDLKNRHGPGNKPTVPEYLAMSSASKVIAMVATYPYQVIRSRLQQATTATSHPLYRGLADVAVKTWRNEGAWAFYRGLVPSTIRVLPGTCITFLVYEKISDLMSRI